MSTTAPPVEAAREPQRRDVSPTVLGIALVVAIVGAAGVWRYAEGITRRLDGILPQAMTVRSNATPFPSFADAYPYTLRALALSVVAAVAVALVVELVGRDRVAAWVRRSDAWAPAGAAAVVVVAFGVFWHFGWPFNPFDNARIHWVDILYGERTDSFFYTLVKPFHIVFYERPHVWNALIGAACIALVYAVGRRLFTSRWVPVLMAASLLTSGILLVFADAAEDVKLNLAALLLAAYVYLRRSPVALGAMLVVVTWGRPSFVLLAVAVVVAELVLGPPGAERSRSLGAHLRAVWDDRLLPVALAVFGGVLLVWHTFLLVMGWSWLWRDGELLPVGVIGEGVARPPVEGFTISSWSGAYTLHLLWMFPLVLLVANVVVAGRFRSLGDRGRRMFVMTWVFTILSVVQLELEPVHYYNLRYIAYAFPFVLVCGWLVLATRPRFGRAVVPTAAVVVLLALAPATVEQFATEIRSNVLDIPVVALMDDRGAVRDVVGDEPIMVGHTVGSTDPVAANTLAYVLRRDVRDIEIVDVLDPPAGGLVYVEPNLPLPPGEIVYRAGDAWILRLAPS